MTCLDALLLYWAQHNRDTDRRLRLTFHTKLTTINAVELELFQPLDPVLANLNYRRKHSAALIHNTMLAARQLS